MPATPQDTQQSWHTLSPEAALAVLASGEGGLASAEAEERLRNHGPNRIHRQARESLLVLFWRQINNPLLWVLMGSAALAVLLGKFTDGLVVLAVVVINAVIGFVQEYRAGRAIEALSSLVPENATVLRDGRRMVVSATDLVPGDVVLLAAGDSVPADMRLLVLKNLQVEEAALTGESVPVAKSLPAVPGTAVLGDRTCMVYSSTLVTSGTATALVVATGMATELGRISAMLTQTVDLQTPLTRRLAEVSTWITLAIVIISVVILAAGVKRSLDMGVGLFEALKETLIFAIALAVGAIPEGLPAVVTIALAIGVQRMARRHAIIRRLPAVETLGSTTVICTDKTGTLTRNEMTVTEAVTSSVRCRFSGSGYAPEGELLIDGRPATALPPELRELLAMAALCNDAGLHVEGGRWQISGDPTEAALLVAAVKAGLDLEGLRSRHPRSDELPFASEQQYMATLHGGTEPFLIVKGAPEVVVARCANPDLKAWLAGEMERLGAGGMRVLAVAVKPAEQGSPALEETMLAGGLRFLGLIGMIDPPRPEAIAAIRTCHQAGIEVKMITGDHRATARAIGVELGLGGEAEPLTGEELAEMDEAALLAAAKSTHIFARVAPEHKLALVRALQKDRQIVAMTGDGVNDAPSLKQADIGVAMGIAGTAVSKESAAIVLADDNFQSIAAAVEEGRRVYDNLIKSLAFLLPTNLGLALILVWGILFFPFDPATRTLLLPMLPTQLLWINLVAAVALALPLAFEVKEPDIMSRPPRRPEAPLFSGFVVYRVVSVSLLMTAGTVVLFLVEYDQQLAAGLSDSQALGKAQTMAVTFVILFQIFYMLHCRSFRAGLATIGLFSNPTIFAGIGVVTILQLLFIYLPFFQRIFHTAALTPTDLLITGLAGFAVFPLISLEKWLRCRLGR